LSEQNGGLRAQLLSLALEMAGPISVIDIRRKALSRGIVTRALLNEKAIKWLDMQIETMLRDKEVSGLRRFIPTEDKTEDGDTVWKHRTILKQPESRLFYHQELVGNLRDCYVSCRVHRDWHYSQFDEQLELPEWDMK
jgi:hypothetical protein